MIGESEQSFLTDVLLFKEVRPYSSVGKI